MTIGTFDLFHSGHGRLLYNAHSLGELHVGINSDRFVEEYKGRPPVQPELERRWFVQQFRAVKSAIINDGPGAALVRLLEPDLLVIGSDWHDRYLRQIGITHAELFSELRCGIVYLPRTPGVSTSELRA